MDLKWNDQGLIPAILQDAGSGEVLMLAYMNPEALRRTWESGEAWFWSRSRAALWRKGATSGNRMRVREMRADCDGDALLLKVDPAGPACHTGERSCFFNHLPGPDSGRAAPITSGVTFVARRASSCQARQQLAIASSSAIRRALKSVPARTSAASRAARTGRQSPPGRGPTASPPGPQWRTSG